MTDEARLKSGDELVALFFKEILTQDTQVDPDTKAILIDLYQSGQFKADKIEKKLQEIRQKT